MKESEGCLEASCVAARVSLTCEASARCVQVGCTAQLSNTHFHFEKIHGGARLQDPKRELRNAWMILAKQRPPLSRNAAR